MKKYISSLLLLLSLSSGYAYAGPIYSFDQPGNAFTNGSWDFALNFQVLNEVTVTGLGYYADPASGAVDDNAVALYDSNRNLLASVVVDNSYDVFDFFRYVTIDALVLAPGFYQVVGVSRGDNYTWDNINHVFDPNIAYVSNSWASDFDGIANFVSGTKSDTQFGFSGPNVFIGDSTAFTGANRVPAPGSVVLLGIGLLLVGARRFI